MLKIIIEKTIDDCWATDDQFDEMSDLELIEFFWEDIGDFLDKADWKFTRRVEND